MCVWCTVLIALRKMCDASFAAKILSLLVASSPRDRDGSFVARSLVELSNMCNKAHGHRLGIRATNEASRSCEGAHVCLFLVLMLTSVACTVEGMKFESKGRYPKYGSKIVGMQGCEKDSRSEGVGRFVQGCKPPAERVDVCMSSNTSPASSYQSPGDGMSLIPWLKTLSSTNNGAPTTAIALPQATMASSKPTTTTTIPPPGLVNRTSSNMPPLQIMRGGTCSAPVTPPLSSPRLPYVKPEWPDLSKTPPDPSYTLPDCAAAAFFNAWPLNPFLAASGTSTPTHPSSSFLLSGTSTPPPFLASGTSTPTYPSSYLPSGACTPTSHPHPSLTNNIMRAGPSHFAAALSNLSFRADASSAVPQHDGEYQGTLVDKPGKIDSVARQDGNPGSVNSGSTQNGAVASLPAAVALDNIANRSFHQPNSAIRAVPVPDAGIILPEISRENMEMDLVKLPPRLANLVKPWEGETIHEVSLAEEDLELELTLGNSTTKGMALESSCKATAMAID